ncbi:hypothetical protein JCM2811A_11350 [Methylorubrum rhodinum]
MEVMSERHDRTAGRVSFGARGRPAGRKDGTVAVGTLAQALAILALDLIDVLEPADAAAAQERLANRLDAQGRTPGGSQTAALLGAVAVADALMQLET